MSSRLVVYSDSILHFKFSQNHLVYKNHHDTMDNKLISSYE
jgi:hypothetical protein